MKQSTKEQVVGAFHEVKGKVKEKVGQATGNPDSEVQGLVEGLGGTIREQIG